VNKALRPILSHRASAKKLKPALQTLCWQALRHSVNGTARKLPRTVAAKNKRRRTMLGTILLIVLILMLLGAVPAWPYSRDWGYAPSGGLGLVLAVVLILMLLGHFPQ
jgi:hypothetical protein